MRMCTPPPSHLQNTVMSPNADLTKGNGATSSRSLLPIMTRFSQNLLTKDSYDNS